jgi:hypothetical protein
MKYEVQRPQQNITLKLRSSDKEDQKDARKKILVLIQH